MSVLPVPIWRPAVRRALLAAAAVLLGLLGIAAALLEPLNPWPTNMLVPVLVLGLASGAAGWSLQGVPRMQLDGLFWGLGGVVLLTAAVGGGGWLPGAVTERLLWVAALTLLPLAIVAFPGPMPAAVRSVAVPLLLAVGGLALVTGYRSNLLDGLGLAVAVLVTAAVWWRFERGAAERRPGPERDALRWLALGLVITLLLSIPASFATPGPLVTLTLSVAGLVVPASVALGAHPPKVDIRMVAARVGGSLLTLLMAFALFAGVVDGLRAAGMVIETIGALALVAMSVAAVFEPIRRLVDRTTERLLFGDQLDPVGAASHFATELSTADDPAAALRGLRTMLGLPYAAVRDVGDRALLESGHRALEGEYELPLFAAGMRVGSLVLGLRPGERGPSVRDRPVLRIVAPALAQALRARALAEEVAASRERVVTAVEEDRRRLRRDLHDGLGPTLTGVAYATDAARNLLRSDPALAEDLLTGARTDTGAAIAEIRQLVDGLRPAVLDQLGLLPALRHRAAQLRGPDGHRIEVALDLADDLPELTAATEVAVYRIVTEALTNVARHSGSPTALVQLEVEDDRLLVVEVSDVGRPGEPTGPWRPGIGLQSMRERVDQLGGTFDVTADGDGGRVRVTLPLPRHGSPGLPK